MEKTSNERFIIFSKPFIDAIKNVFTTMVFSELSSLAPDLRKQGEKKAKGDISIVMGLNGNFKSGEVVQSFKGMMVLSFSIPVYVKIANAMLSVDYKEKESKEISDRKQKLDAHKQKSQKTLSELHRKSSDEIENIKSTLNNLVSLLNQIPESFDSNSLSWHNDNILKGKELVATNFRIGSENLKIVIQKDQHSIDVPRCFPFLNKFNIAFNCNTQNEIKEAIRVFAKWLFKKNEHYRKLLLLHNLKIESHRWIVERALTLMVKHS